MTMKVGFIGLGIMGKPMSKNLLKAGYSLVVADRNPESIAEVIAAGAETAATAKDIAEQCDVIITMLPNSPHVTEVAAAPKETETGCRQSCRKSTTSTLWQSRDHPGRSIPHDKSPETRDVRFGHCPVCGSPGS